MITKKELAKLGSTNLLDWMKECVDIIEEDFKPFYKKDTSVFHIDPMNLDSFKDEVESYAKRHPNAKIRASGFMISTDEPKKDKEYKFEQ